MNDPLDDDDPFALVDRQQKDKSDPPLRCFEPPSFSNTVADEDALPLGPPFPGKSKDNEDNRASEPWLIIGPCLAGKTCLLMAFGRAVSMPGNDDLSLALIPSEDLSRMMSLGAEFITGKSGLMGTNKIDDYSFEIHTNSKVESTKKTVPVSLDITVTDGPGGALFSDAFDRLGGSIIEFWQSHLISVARRAKSLIFCVDSSNPTLELLEKNLPSLIAKFVELQNISVENPEKPSFWDRVFGRRSSTQIARQRYLKVDNFLILLNKIDILCDDYEMASRIDPLNLGHQLLGTSLINQIRQALKPDAQLAIGVTSSLGFDPTTGFPLADSTGHVLRGRDITESDILRRWTPFGIRDALIFLATRQATGNVKLVTPEHLWRIQQEGFTEILAQELQQIDSIDELSNASEIVKSHPDQAGYFLFKQRISRISTLAQDYLKYRELVGQLKVLEELQRELHEFRNATELISSSVSTAFHPLASHWLEIVMRAEEKCRQQLSFDPIPNPFVAGNPLQRRDHDLFKGRKDIIVAIEENIINPSQRPALLLYGRRRTGKTSTLLNLPRLISSKFTPVFIDCQSAKWRDGDAAFCYHLAGSVYGELFQLNRLDGLDKPVFEQFEKYAFSRLDEFLDQVEALLRRINKQILLTFDEYEAMEQGIAAQKITHEVFNQLRNIVQHRERIVVLFSGGHRFEELRVVNWSDYLINFKTLELNFLAPEDARELLTEPVPALHYEPGVVDKIIALTHCQPYLLQAVACDLVNYLNAQKRQTATMADLDVAVAKVLVTADPYFHNNWEECAEAEREVLRALTDGAADIAASPQYQAAVQSLSRKEIVEMRDGRYGFAVELFKLWILKNHLPAASSFSQ